MIEINTKNIITNRADEIKEVTEDSYYRILNLEGAWLIKDTSEPGITFTYSTTGEKKVKIRGEIKKYAPDINKLYLATMPYSLEIIRAFEKYPEEIFDIGNEKATNLFVNFKFSKDFIDNTDDDSKSKKIKKKRLRKLIYTSKVTIDDVEYCYFKRGASKARTANVIFVKKDCYDALFSPCLLGLKINDTDEYDITGLSAYISLIMSGIIGTVEIKPEEILIINDIMSPEFTAAQSLTKYNNEGKIEQFVDKYKVSNNTTDGQVLLDESIFTDNELLKTATCVLLRNDFFKGNAVRTKLQEFWKENEITQVWDMYRGWIPVDKIKLCITPSACKYLKFADKFESEKDCFLNWLEKIPSTYGVVKTDHVGRYGYSNRLSYQMLNSMNVPMHILQTKIMKDELNYYKLMKDNTLITSSDLKKLPKKDRINNRVMRNDMTYFINHISQSNDDDTDISSKDMFAELLKVDSDFRFTKQFKDWKKDQLRDYVDNLRLGKIRIQNSIYAIMVSCPYEMLVSTTKENNEVKTSIMNGWEMYCPNFFMNEELLAIRNPQINAGNIGFFKNQWHEEYKWFGYYNENGEPTYKFVTFINSWNVDTMNRLQGCDFDIDTAFLTNNSTLVQYSKDSQSWSTPVNGIEGERDYRRYNNRNLADLDNYLGGSTQLIGKIVNKSAIFNAYMYDGINKRMCHNYVDSCYKASSTLSSFSQIAIDMAKKSFGNLSLTKQMNALNKTTYIDNDMKSQQVLKYDYDTEPEEITIQHFIKDYEKAVKNTTYIPKYKLVNQSDLEWIKELINYIKKVKDEKVKDDKELLSLIIELSKKVNVFAYKMIVPYFFKFVAQDNSYRIPTKMKCGMDYLEGILDDLDTKAMRTDTMDIKKLLVMQKDLSGKAFNRDKVDKARTIIDKCKSTLNQNRYDINDTDKEKNDKDNLRKWAKKTAAQELKGLKLNDKTVYRILLRAFDLDENYQGQVIPKLKDNGEEIYYTDHETEGKKCLNVRELKEMDSLVMTLLHKAYHDLFIQCFIKKDSDIKQIKRFWK